MTKLKIDDFFPSDDEEEEGFEDYSNLTTLEKLSSIFEKKLQNWIKEDKKEIYQETFEYKNTTELKIKIYNQGSNFLSEDDKLTPGSNIILSEENDFPTKGHHLNRWFGVQNFIVITTDENFKHLDENNANFILSALSIALNNLYLSISCFVSIGDPKKQIYFGRLQTSEEIIKFQSENTKEITPIYSDLKGLLDLFSFLIENKNIKVNYNVRYTYMKDTFTEESWNQIINEANMNTPVYLLSYGTLSDIINSLHISCQWKSFDQNSIYVIKNILDPITAEYWSIRCILDINSESELTHTLKSFFNLYCDSLTQKSTMIGKLSGLSPLKKNENIDIKSKIKYIFQSNYERNIKIENKLPKSVEPGSLLSSFVIQASLLNDIETIDRMWKRFVAVLREHWESERLIPLQKENQNPDWQFNLLEQKITMLNCCIKESIKSSKIENNQSLLNEDLNNVMDGWNFLDVNEEIKEESESQSTISSENLESGDDDDDDDKFFDVEEIKNEDLSNRRGILKRLSNKFLHNGLPLYIPITQTFPPHTEDMISQQQNIFENLGSGEDAAKIRAQMQSESLLSDMESFKAANPGCNINDFLQWYSPKDVDENCNLSERMNTEENIWKRTWKEAKKRPIEEQKKLFDFVREAELSLHYLETIDLKTLMEHLLKGLFVIGYYTLRNTPVSNLEPIDKLLNLLKDKLNSIFNQSSIIFEKVKDLCNEFDKVEKIISYSISLNSRFCTTSTSLDDISSSTSLDDTSLKIITKLCSPSFETNLNQNDELSFIKKFISFDDHIDEPEAKEIICRGITSKKNGKYLSHKIYSILSQNELRIATTISKGIPF
eukprot:gene5072-8672_t